MGAAALSAAHPPPGLGDVAETSAPSGSSATASTAGPPAPGGRRVVEVPAKQRDHAARVLEPVPAGDLATTLAPAGTAPPAAARPALDPAGGAVGAHELGRVRRAVGGEPDRAEDRVDVPGSRSWFFGEKGSIDGGMNQAFAFSSPSQSVLAAREDVGVGLLDVGAEEVPGAAGELVRLVDPDVAAPDDRGPRLLHRRRPARPSGGRAGRRRRRSAEAGELRRWSPPGSPRRAARASSPSVAAVAGVAVEAVVDALGDGEELGCLAQHDPAGVDAGAAHVGEQRPQHLRHAAAAEGGADVPDRPPLERSPGPRRSLFDLVELLAQQGPVAVERVGRDLDELRLRQALKRRSGRGLGRSESTRGGP